MKRVSVIVVSYQVRELLRRCLETVVAQAGVDLELCVVDNASDDGSAELVATLFPQARLLRNRENVGFARANNQALAIASGAILVLLNPDTELPPGALATALEVFSRHPRAGAVGLSLRNVDGTRQAACHSFPSVFNLALESVALHHVALRLGMGSPTEARLPRGGEGRVDWVSGACMILSREAFAAVGGLDEALFMYGEEMDWSWRAKQRGYETVFSTAACVVHHGGASGSGARGPLFVHNTRSRLRFLERYRGKRQAALARDIVVAGARLRLKWWTAIEARERSRGSVSARTRDQVERFSSVVEWWRASAS